MSRFVLLIQKGVLGMSHQKVSRLEANLNMVFDLKFRFMDSLDSFRRPDINPDYSERLETVVLAIYPTPH